MNPPGFEFHESHPKSHTEYQWLHKLHLGPIETFKKKYKKKKLKKYPVHQVSH